MATMTILFPKAIFVKKLPNGYGVQFKDNAPIGPQLNMLTPSSHCEPLTKTPFHKYLPVKIVKLG